jgi:hypothetical protein
MDQARDGMVHLVRSFEIRYRSLLTQRFLLKVDDLEQHTLYDVCSLTMWSPW